MREIKFRAWDHFNKEMLNPHDTNNNKKDLSWFFNQFEACDKNGIRLSLMQFTGLVDKNGNEIYEGDLMEVPVNDTMREGTHEVFYYHDGFVTSSILFSDKETANKNSLTWIINRGAKVIGNIFENPRLLAGGV